MKPQVSILALTIAFILTGCGGGDSATAPVNPGAGTTPVNPGTGSSPDPVIINGVITGFGSIVVNGVHYSTNASTISTDDNPSATEQELAVGMLVQVDGTLNADGSTGSARTIKYGAQIEGPVSFVDLANNQLTVLGQLIDVDDLTVYERVTFETIKAGDVLEISGFVKATGRFYASRIQRETSQTSQFKLFGNVSNLDTTAKTFTLGAIKVLYSTATFKDLTEAQLANGQLVKIKSQKLDTTTNTVTATSIELHKASTATTGKMWQEGIVANYQPDVSFMVNDQLFLLNSDTKFEYGLKSLLANGVAIKVKAKKVTDGWLAEKISFVQQSVAKLSGKVSALDLTNNTLTVGTTPFIVTPQTVFKDDSNRAIRFFELKSLVVNDYVEVVAYKNAEGNLVALKVERENEASSDDDIELKGVPTAITADGFSLYGKEITTDSNTRYESSDKILTKTEFFGLLTSTSVVEVHAVAAANKLLAVKLELKTPRSNGGVDNGAGGKVEFKGALVSKQANEIVVNGYTVTLSQSTKLKIDKTRNMSAADFIAALVIGETVKVEGVVDANKVVKAVSIEVEREKD